MAQPRLRVKWFQFRSEPVNRDSHMGSSSLARESLFLDRLPRGKAYAMALVEAMTR
jgi:hypothetical protein